MAHQKLSVIEINGRRYDAQTGEVLSPQPVEQVTAPTITPVISTPPARSDMHREPAHHAKAHSPQHASTLMRRSVHKPAKSVRLQAQTNTGVLATVPNISVTPKLSALKVHGARLARAKSVNKSDFVQHYAPTTSLLSPQYPTGRLHSAAAQTTVHHSTVSGKSITKPASHAVFERALAHANAHEEPPFNPKKHLREQRRHARRLKRVAKPIHRRSSTLAAVSLSVLAITGVVALQYRPVLTMHFANAKAGFSASLPGFRPAGFGYGSFTYRPNLVNIQFKADTSNRSFNLQQQSSNWDSQTLLVNQVIAGNHTYQTLRVGDRTVYVYGQNNASWIDDGILYQLTSNGSLSTNDVLNIAGSI